MTLPESVESIVERHRALLSGSLLTAERRAEIRDGAEAVRELQGAQRKRLEERLGETRAARERAVERFDREIARLELQLEQLDRATEPPDARPGGGGLGGGGTRRPAPPLREVTGVGRALAERLETAGLKDAAALAAAAPEKIAAAIEIGVEQATKLVESARKLVGR